MAGLSAPIGDGRLVGWGGARSCRRPSVRAPSVHKTTAACVIASPRRDRRGATPIVAARIVRAPDASAFIGRQANISRSRTSAIHAPRVRCPDVGHTSRMRAVSLLCEINRVAASHPTRARCRPRRCRDVRRSSVEPIAPCIASLSGRLHDGTDRPGDHTVELAPPAKR